jgi:transposase
MRPISQTIPQKLSHCRSDGARLYASLELSQATWLVTSLSPDSEKMSKYSTLGGDGAALLGLLGRLQVRAERLTGGPVDIVVIQEAGLDGFWVHRLLNAKGIESHVVDPASIAVPRRRRRAKTDAIVTRFPLYFFRFTDPSRKPPFLRPIWVGRFFHARLAARSPARVGLDRDRADAPSDGRPKFFATRDARSAR